MVLGLANGKPMSILEKWPQSTARPGRSEPAYALVQAGLWLLLAVLSSALALLAPGGVCPVSSIGRASA